MDSGGNDGGAMARATWEAMVLLFDRMPDTVFFVKDEAARYVAVNRTLLERCGVRSADDLLGRTSREVFPAPLGERYHEQDLHVLAGSAVRDNLERHLYVRGGAGWGLTNKVPLRNPGGTVSGLVGTSRDLEPRAERDAEYRGVAATVRHIQASFGEPLRVDALAAMAGLSTYQFEERMKKIFQLTAGQFITKTRIDAACDLLEHSSRPLAEIALDCGFCDQSAFSRQFKATTGVTPTQFRRAGGE